MRGKRSGELWAVSGEPGREVRSGVGWRVVVLVVCLLLPVSFAEARKKKNSKKTVQTQQSGENFVMSDWLLKLSLSSRSVSAGQTNDGSVSNSESMEVKGRTWQFLPAVSGRRTNYGKTDLVRLLKSGADAVDEQFPGSVLTIGNIGLESGGKIVQSKSHQAGRDVDVAPYYRDKKGRMAHPARFFPVDSEGKSRRGLELDVARTWAFVKALVQSEDPVVQWMFVSEGVKKLLIDHARKSRESRELIRRAEVILHQPTDSSDHSDHFHIRVFCSSWDRLAGCVDYGPVRAHLKRDLMLENELLADLTRRAGHGTGKERLAATRRLAVVHSDKAPAALEALLCDEDVDVVKAALDGLASMTRQQPAQRILAHLKCASGIQARQLLLAAVQDYLDERVWKLSARLLKSDDCLKIDDCKGPLCRAQRQLCESAARTLGLSADLSYGRVLTPYVTSKARSTRRAAVASLEILYGTDTPPGPDGAKQRPPLAERWKHLVDKNSRQRWDLVLRRRFKQASFNVTGALARKNNAAVLLKALEKDSPLAWSAQLALARIFGLQLTRALSRKDALQTFRRLVDSSGHNRKRGGSPRQAGKLPSLPL